MISMRSCVSLLCVNLSFEKTKIYKYESDKDSLYIRCLVISNNSFVSLVLRLLLKQSSVEEAKFQLVHVFLVLSKTS